MRRKATANTRGANAAEKRLMDWTAEQSCVICFRPGPSIVEHMYGATFRHNKVLIGMFAVLSYCQGCDDVKTHGSHRAHKEVFGFTQAELYLIRIESYPSRAEIPDDVIAAIRSWNR